MAEVLGYLQLSPTGPAGECSVAFLSWKWVGMGSMDVGEVKLLRALLQDVLPSTHGHTSRLLVGKNPPPADHQFNTYFHWNATS